MSKRIYIFLSLSFFLFSIHFNYGQSIKVSEFLSNSNSNANIALQKALQSDFDTIILDNDVRHWVFTPLTISNLKKKIIVIEKDIEIHAKKKSFPKPTDSLFEFLNCEDIHIYGNGAKICMNKDEYIDGEWRHAFSLKKSKNITIKNLEIYGSGGDGLYISGMEKGTFSENIFIENILSSNNKRQGISIISARNVHVIQSRFANTVGTLPGAGVDIEPNNKWNTIDEIFFSQCIFENNDHSGILIALSKLDSTSHPINIKFERCIIRSNHSKENTYVASEIVLSANKESPVKGKVSFNQCTIENSEWGFLYSRKVKDAYTVSFEDCIIRNICKSETYPPVLFEVPDYHFGSYSLGGYNFKNITVKYETKVPLLLVRGSSLGTLVNFSNVKGQINLFNSKSIDFIEYIKYNPTNNINVDLLIDKVN
ncbi:right-handed parallel beta-helix repeat-containing protein [uncultured Zobellia sp.]|uniref:right-handed parallel beta-helix repeat-containing protein n=1 Tax=uncultured Zobellia sp. TaxID=255433 RepID=UPI00259AD692|nr:right-handed parallel beta-helix repeat-containing protein [uncultured Zobellia sp.]